jgi:molybdopterin biosynthesis enzyme
MEGECLVSTSFEEARSLVMDATGHLGTERVPLLDAIGRVLAEAVRTPWDMPLYDNSAMDGIAVLPAERTTFAAGGQVDVILIGPLAAA